MFKWEPGRQGTGYEKLKIWERWRFFARYKWDIYLLRYKVGSGIPRHKDPVPNHRHWRLNIYIRDAKAGGHPLHDGVIYSNRWFTLFRPDLYVHSVTTVTAGTRYVLSLGLTKHNRF